MTNNPCFRYLSLLLGLSLFGECLAADQPNFVWFTSEDNSVHFSRLYNEDGIAMPTIEKLASHGLIFEHAFSNAPVCSVARTTLLTGAYAPRIGAQYHRRSKMVPMPDRGQMYPWYLQQAGYYTTNNSKTDYNVLVDQGWNESSTDALWRGRKQGQPFFHVQNTTLTHESSLHFTREEMMTIENLTPSESVNLFPYFPDTPTFRYTHARYLDNHVKVDNYFGEYLNMLEEDGVLDDTFIFYFGDHGGVLPRGKGYAYENGLHVPLIVYVPENWKHLVNEEYGARVTGFVSFIDFAPTVLSLAGIEVPPHMDGIPFLGQGIDLKEVNKRDQTFGYADRFDEKIDHVRSLRKGNFKYIRNYQPFNVDGLWNEYRYIMLAYQEWWKLYRSGELDEVQSQFFEPRPAEQLFDLENDPYELQNLAGDFAYAEILGDMRSSLSSKVKSINDLSMFPESMLFEEAFDDPVVFGRNNSQRISQLVDTADLSLREFDRARDDISLALNSEDPWQRYWGLIVLSTFGEQADRFIQRANDIAKSDDENLVRLRAIEFLALIGQENPSQLLPALLASAANEVEATIILNTAVLLRDFTEDDIQIESEMIPPSLSGPQLLNIDRRLNYLSSD